MRLYRKKNSPYFYYDFEFNGRHRGSTKEKSKTAAGVVMNEMMTRMRNASHLPQRGRRAPLLRDFLQAFQDNIEASQVHAKNTRLYYRNGVRLLMDSELRDLPLDRISRSAVSRITFPHSSSTANNAIRTLSSALSYAVELGYLPAAPKLALHRETGRWMTFTPEFERRLLEVAPQPLHDVFIVLMDTGMRPEEVYRMRFDLVDWHGLSYHIDSGKTLASTRDVPISDRVEELLRRRVREHGHKSRWVFPTQRGTGRRVSNSRKTDKHIYSVSKAFREARATAQLPLQLVLYATRHTFGTDMMAATKDARLTMKSMGHTDIKTSVRYQHPETQRVTAAINARNAERKALPSQVEKEQVM